VCTTKEAFQETMDIDVEQTAKKKMKIVQPKQIVDLEDEGPRDQLNLNTVESGTNIVEIEERIQFESEGSSRVSHSQKYYFDKAPDAAYQSREDLEKQYDEKRNVALGEIRDLFPEVEKNSQLKSSLFTVRDIENKTFNIAVAEENKVSEIKIKYENISSPDKVKFHKQTSDLLYSDYLSLNLKNSKMTSLAAKLEGQLRQEKASNKAWKTQIKRLESEGPQGLKYLLEEKDKIIQSLKKKLKMLATEHPQTTELVALEQEKETFWKEALDYKAKILQLEKEKMEWSKEKVELVNKVMVLSPAAGTGSTTEDIVQAMSQVSLKEGEIKGLKENMEKLEQEVHTKDEKISQVQKEKVVLQEKINKLNSRLRGKGLLQGDKHIIWDSIVVEAAKFRSYLNFVSDKDNIAITSMHRCTVVNETLAKNPSEWAQNSINILNSVPPTDLQTIGVKDRTALIIWARRIITKHDLLKSVLNKAIQMEQSVQNFKNLFEELFIKGLPSFWDGKGKL
jgi:hypothetical protein